MLKKFITRVARGQKGFTLIEMIVVVGIIAVLAAVIVPNIGRFIGSGEAGAKDAEQAAVQTAMHAMMADRAIDAVDEIATGGAPVQNWAAFPAGTDACPLGTNALGGGCPTTGYLQGPLTSYYYCYDVQGLVTKQYEQSEIDAAEVCP